MENRWDVVGILGRWFWFVPECVWVFLSMMEARDVWLLRDWASCPILHHSASLPLELNAGYRLRVVMKTGRRHLRQKVWLSLGLTTHISRRVLSG